MCVYIQVCIYYVSNKCMLGVIKKGLTITEKLVNNKLKGINNSNCGIFGSKVDK